MADLRTSFVVLEDVASQAGRAWHAAVQGDAAAGKNAGPVLAVKDQAGNLQYIPMINGAIPVTFEGVVAGLNANGLVAGNAAFTDVAVITLTPDAEYKKVGFVAGGTRDMRFQIVQVDDMTTTILVQGIVTGAGNMSLSELLESIEFTAGSTGTQELKLQAKCLNALSDMTGTITTYEIQ